MDRFPDSIVSFSLRSKADMQVTITKILHLPMLADCSAIDRSLICTIASELGTNILRYAEKGIVQIKRYDFPDFSDIEIKATDKGPGIPSIEHAMVESYSTGGSLGLGLSGVKRIANKFEIESSPGSGTTVIATKRIRHSLVNIDQERTQTMAVHVAGKSPNHQEPSNLPFQQANNASLDIGIRVRCNYGHRLSGDQVAISPLPNGYLIGIIDVTGHGPNACVLANRLANHMKEHATPDLLALMNLLHEEATDSLGASIGLAVIDTRTAQIHYLGLGNTGLLLVSEKNWRPVSRSGVVGMRMPVLTVQTNQFLRDDLLIMFTDGVSESGLTRDLRKLSYKDAGSIANSIIEIAGKKYDDASCVVIKWIK